MGKKYNAIHIGEEYETKEGYIAKVIDGSDTYKLCTIQIEDWVKEVRFDQVKNGQVKYPYHKSVFGVGFIGEGQAVGSIKGKLTKPYQIWSGMIQRCYDKNTLKMSSKSCYVGVKVVDEWHNFQVFAEWFELNYVGGYEIDKDLLSKEVKVYSPDTCLFIPKTLNKFLANTFSSNTSGHTGVCYEKSSGKWSVSISNGEGKRLKIGRYKDIEEAAEAYTAKRAEFAEAWKEKMVGILPQEAIDNIK